MEPKDFNDQLNHNRLVKAYLRLSAETKKIKESPAIYSIRGEPEKPKRKPKKESRSNQPSSLGYSNRITQSSHLQVSFCGVWYHAC
jgi:hypothetical protein